MAIVKGGKNYLTLNTIKTHGTKVKIISLEHSDLKERLMSMGLVPGTKIEVLRSAPMGDPMAIKVRSYNLALRLKDAKNILVEKIEE